MGPPEISAEEKTVLRTVLSNGTVRGFELKKLSGLSDQTLIDVVQSLVAQNFITASGVVNPETVDRVNFAPLSSAYEKSSLFQK